MSYVLFFAHPLKRGCYAATLVALVLTGCAGGPSPHPARKTEAYVVRFAATRAADHTPLLAVSVPVVVGGEGKVRTASRKPAENQPALPAFVVRLQRAAQPGVYEMVTRVTVREAIRNQKGKLKVSERYLGALVPTRPGETQIVSAENDPIHLEARLERR